MSWTTGARSAPLPTGAPREPLPRYVSRGEERSADADATVTGMATSRGHQLRWWLVVVASAIGMIAMHSLVVHEHAQPASSPTAVVAVESSCCEGQHAAPPGTLQHTAPHHGSLLMALLHLCLAVLTGLTVLAIAALLAFVRLGADLSDRPRSPGLRLDRTRSPPPTSVRLAQLCVLRC